jgi:two-component system, LuxR family, sensor kinase FixL
MGAQALTLGPGMLDSFFITDFRTAEVETGVYEAPLVVLSYAVACVASYTALAMAQVMTGAVATPERRLFHWGGAFAMGAGIWSMHFVGMLSYRMRMEVSYDPWMTLLSMLIAIAVAWGALAIIARENLPGRRLIAGGVVLGLGICSMHYTGMAAMKMDADLRYVPGIFLLSVLIAIAASIAALWMTFMLARPGVKFRPLFQIGAALIMGAAICGMHYTGMAAAVFLPWAGCRYAPDQNFHALALSIAATTGLILCVALAAGMYWKAQAELTLLSAEKRLRAVIDSALDAVVTMDQDGRITDWNANAETIFGWSSGEAVGRQLAETIIPPKHREAHHAGMRRFLGDGTGPILGRRIEVDAMRRDGTLFPVELSVTARMIEGKYQFTAFVRDISERLSAEKSQALLAAIVESSDDPMISLALNGKITSWNIAAEKLYGYTVEEAVGQDISLIIPPEHIEEEQRIIADLAHGKSISHYETERLRKDGSRVSISLTVSPIRDKSGNIVAASKVARDITARKTAELELLRYTRALERSNQELDDFAHIASHDLREPLRGLSIQANFLNEDYADRLDDKAKHRLQRLMYLSQRMETLVNELLYYSQLGRAELAVQDTDLNQVVDGIRQMLEQFLKERNGRVVVRGRLPSAVCDRPRVTEVFRNLITNAIKYNDKAERVAEVGFLEIVNGPRGPEKNVFYVRDNGIGIAPEYHEEIFRIFRRLLHPDETETGTGAGLTFVKKIIERHHGNIWLESALGKGTTFYFTLRGTET